MDRPDRVGFLVISFAVFALYLGLANLLTFLGLPLPLGTIGNEAPLIAALGVFLALIYVSSRKKSVQKLP